MYCSIQIKSLVEKYNWLTGMIGSGWTGDQSEITARIGLFQADG